MVTFDELESRLKSLLEIHLVKYLPGYAPEDEIAQLLAAAMHGHLKNVAGEMYAPNQFFIIAHPSKMTRWHAKPDLLKELADAVYVAGKEAGYVFSIKPAVTVTADINMPADKLQIVAAFSDESLAETQGFSQGVNQGSAAEARPTNAFLIVGGTQMVLLTRSVINIGRRLDNHVVIDDLRVSRAHAQLRIIKGQFIIFDLNSSGGTFVNGHRVNRSTLNPGDVISLAGVSLIFGQDLPASRTPGESQTEPGPVVSSKSPTAKPKEENNLAR
jgi:hypothetical protein